VTHSTVPTMTAGKKPSSTGPTDQAACSTSMTPTALPRDVVNGGRHPPSQTMTNTRPKTGHCRGHAQRWSNALYQVSG
jgi:hypothetical protein